ncbi:SDR family NAD(P)-dependent oxidoreductase [Legionella brunensis]|uniref:3-oxoacyl-ACP reductase n=1 Tax=Legionella brunensis TaxID=29422 RepID=A0A0W0SEZ3_9GAMM|nr:SDR family NAD(P)-dependent oxidoreductase [Legionella brunensis]KTC81677.1 3-oxoacyl-ACP reductase [Legionella brunensis]
MRTFLITGCSKGIGLATAKHLAALNYQVIGIARNKPEKFEGIFYQSDLSNHNETIDVFNRIKNNYQIDGIINNVGNVNPQLLEELTLDSFFEVIDLNLRPAIQAAQTFVPSMRKNAWGRIVNISSRAMLGKAGRSSYSSAKASIVALTRTWALELAKDGVTVNAVAPGPIETEGFLKTTRQIALKNKNYSILFQ